MEEWKFVYNGSMEWPFSASVLKGLYFHGTFPVKTSSAFFDQAQAVLFKPTYFLY